MKPLYSIILSFVLLFVSSGAQECDNGWTAYKDELCFQVFPGNLVTYDDAQSFCASQGSGASRGSLVMVKEAELQSLLSATTQHYYDNIWLGGQYDARTTQFKWDDEQPLTYINWQQGYPRYGAIPDSCIEMRPLSAQKDEESASRGGEWADVTCQKRNLAMCQISLSWTLKDAVGEILKLQDQIEYARSERNELRAELRDVSSRVVPVGSIYIEYYNQPSPLTLWPGLGWQDISSSYSGLFFRVTGGGSSYWGDTQAACSPRISQMSYHSLPYNQDFPNPLRIPENGWSEFGRAGYQYYDGQYTREGLGFYTEGCEVRPQNQAVRMWQRIG